MTTDRRDERTALYGETGVFYVVSNDFTMEPTFVGLYSSGFGIDGLPVSLGDISAVTAKDPNVPNQSVIIRTVRSNRDINNSTFTERMRRDEYNVLERMRNAVNCDHTIYVGVDGCADPSVFTEWESMIIAVGLQLTSLDYQTLSTVDGSNEPIEVTADTAFIDHRRVLGLTLGEEADATILAEVVRTVFSNEQSCGVCTPFDDGRNVVYHLTRANAGSPGLSSQIVKNDLRKGTNTTFDITTLGGASGDDMAAVNRRLVVVSDTDEALHYASVDDLTSWTRVATGFVTANGPRKIFALSPNQIFIGGENGYVYTTSNFATGVTVAEDGSVIGANDINAIQGNGEIILFGAAANTLAFTTNQGASFDTITTPAGQAGQAVTAVYVINKSIFLIGYDDGSLWYTERGIDSVSADWTQINLGSDVSYIRDLQFVPGFEEVGYVAVDTGSGATARGRIYRTLANGRPNSWSDELPFIRQLNTLPARLNTVAVAGVNRIASGGLKTNLTDGIAVVGAANDG